MTITLKKNILTALTCLAVSVNVSPMSVFAGVPHPVCHHGDIGTNISTMRELPWRTIHTKNWEGIDVERVWYQCTVCAYERYVDFPINW